ncbi:MAG: UDP-N-acetylmuramoyl-L-alanyl-D-glutamate--2,6-diaminopimelate ligase [Peptococcaceae bacterium]|jgi:UDP-N-acetylmuramoyl-L-alanyl-D-glutamate--2,6-diaminopimelate ligase|nr:UDP-N-acetylmuramoyl-L-alanyl-D-glutamate--2,6-diaminopimelate ligase [Peptococcaceae bacterium]
MPGLTQMMDGIEAMRMIKKDVELNIRGVAVDSRNVQPGDLFACVSGFQTDGHRFAADAVAAGAAALLVERELPLEIPQIVVGNVRQAIGNLAANIYGQPAQKLELIGVTGTNGKTTVTHLIEKIGTKHGQRTGLIGTLGAKISDREMPGSRTTPEAVDLQKLLVQMLAADIDQVVMEVSSHALDLGRVHGCEFDAAIFTNLSQDHLDYHRTMKDYLGAKARLFSALKGSKKRKKLALINADDPACAVLTEASAVPVIRYAIQTPAEYQAQDVCVSAQGVRFSVEFKGERQEMSFQTPGLFSVYNVLASFAWGVERGYPPGSVAEAIAEVDGISGRFESVRAGQPFQVIVDYAHTPDGLENVLRTAREFTKGTLITVFGCGGDRDKTKRPLMGNIAAHWSDYVMVTSDNPRSEEPEEIIREILTGVRGVDYRAVTERREAIRQACMMAKADDTVMIAGKGHETYQLIGADVHPFDDREEARAALRGLGYERLD